MKIDQAKIPVEGDSYELIRERDQLILKGSRVKYVEWTGNGTFKEAHEQPLIGRSVILDPHRLNYTWLTTPITEILEESEEGNYLKFKTENSEYELFKTN
jgi:hypothetical protein